MDPKSLPAFPVPLNQGESWRGMALRDYLAGKALQGICAHPDTWWLLQTDIARTAYEMADEMLTARG